MKNIRKIFAVFLVTVLSAGILGACGGNGDNGEDTAVESSGSLIDLNDYVREISSDDSVEDQAKYELRNYALMQAIQPIFENESYLEYSGAVMKMKKNPSQELIDAAVEARNNMVQLESIKDRVWFLWDGVTMPLADGESYTEEELDAASLLGADYEPVVLKYLLDDPTSAKGNIIACSGGGFQGRSNGSEGYPAAEVFNEMGYNYFLVQRRVLPYSEIDIFMDFQRAVRFVKYYAEKEGWGGQNMIAGVGWSGGSATVMGAVNQCYGSITPQTYDTDYVPDEIDEVNSDMDVAMIIYGPGSPNPENTNWPAFYICQGSEDEVIPESNSQNMYNEVISKVPAMVRIIEGAPHGYGVGTNADTKDIPGVADWPIEADTFMQSNLGHNNH